MLEKPATVGRVNEEHIEYLLQLADSEKVDLNSIIEHKLRNLSTIYKLCDLLLRKALKGADRVDPPLNGFRNTHCCLWVLTRQHSQCVDQRLGVEGQVVQLRSVLRQENITSLCSCHAVLEVSCRARRESYCALLPSGKLLIRSTFS